MADPIFPYLIRGVGTPLISKAGGIFPLFLGGRAYDTPTLCGLRPRKLVLHSVLSLPAVI